PCRSRYQSIGPALETTSSSSPPQDRALLFSSAHEPSDTVPTRTSENLYHSQWRRTFQRRDRTFYHRMRLQQADIHVLVSREQAHQRQVRVIYRHRAWSRTPYPEPLPNPSLPDLLHHTCQSAVRESQQRN